MKWSFLPKQWYFIIAFTIFGQSLFGQTINTCNAVFTDVGGPSGNYDILSSGSYSGSGNIVSITYCGVTPAQGIRAIFKEFTIKQADTMFVYDGNSTAAPLIGKFTGRSNIRSSFYSSGQCLTFSFTSLAIVVQSIRGSADCRLLSEAKGIPHFETH